MPGPGHNSGDDPEMQDLLGDTPAPEVKPTLAKVHLDSIIERALNLDSEMKNLRDDMKDLMSEAKAAGFDKFGISEILKMKRMDAEKFADREGIRDLYLGQYLDD